MKHREETTQARQQQGGINEIDIISSHNYLLKLTSEQLKNYSRWSIDSKLNFQRV